MKCKTPCINITTATALWKAMWWSIGKYFPILVDLSHVSECFIIRTNINMLLKFKHIPWTRATITHPPSSFLWIATQMNNPAFTRKYNTTKNTVNPFFLRVAHRIFERVRSLRRRLDFSSGGLNQLPALMMTSWLVNNELLSWWKEHCMLGEMIRRIPFVQEADDWRLITIFNKNP